MSFRRDPFRELWTEVGRISDEVNRAFGARPPAAGPAVSVWADENNVLVEADLPGVDPARIDVTVTEGNKLTIAGERDAPSQESAVWVRQDAPRAGSAASSNCPSSWTPTASRPSTRTAS